MLLRDNYASTSYGGALVTGIGVARVWNSTFSGNSAEETGGAISAFGTLYLTHVTIANNDTAPGRAGGVTLSSEGFLHLRNSIIGDNSGVQCEVVAPWGVDAYGSVSSDSTCGVTTSQAGNIVADPLLGPLAINGGNSLTHALLVGSPALDRGRAQFCLFIDQRGYQRPIDGDNDGVARCDAGAFEYKSTGPPPGVSGLWHAKMPGAPLLPKPTGGGREPGR